MIVEPSSMGKREMWFSIKKAEQKYLKITIGLQVFKAASVNALR